MGSVYGFDLIYNNGLSKVFIVVGSKLHEVCIYYGSKLTELKRVLEKGITKISLLQTLSVKRERMN